jgi:ABC-type transporter Mla subunit MlaD
MANVYRIALASGRTFAVSIARVSVSEYRPAVLIGALRDGEVDARKALALATRDDMVHLNSLRSESDALAESVCYVASEHSSDPVREVLREGEYTRAQLVAALDSNSRGAVAASAQLNEATEQARQEGARAEELSAALSRARNELDQANELCKSIARDREDRDQFIRTLTTGAGSA